MSVSELCLDLGLPLIDTAIMEDGFAFKLRLIMPGQVRNVIDCLSFSASENFILCSFLFAVDYHVD